MRHLTFCGAYCGACRVDCNARWSAFCRLWFTLGINARREDWSAL